MQQNSLKKNVAYNVFRTLMQIVFPLITFPYASRVLLPEGIGKVNFASSIIQYFALLGSLGISTYGIREAAKVRSDKQKFSKTVKEIFYINCISTIIAYILFFVALITVPKFKNYKILLCITSATILFTTMGLEWIYSALEDFKYITIRSFIFQCVSLILLFCFVHESDDYVKYAAISVFANVGSNICNFFYSHNFLVHVTEKLEIKKHLKPIFILFSKSVAVSVYTMLDTTMLGFMISDREVGIYSIATKLIRIMTSLILAASGVFMPRLSYYVEQKEKNNFQTILSKSLNMTLCFSIPSVIGFICIAKPIILLIGGPEYIHSIIVMQIMSPLMIVLAISNFTGMQIFIPLRKEKYILYSTIAGAIINAIINYLLIPRYGAVGAGTASVVAELVVVFIQFYFARRYFTFKTLFFPFLQYTIGASCFIFPLLLVQKFITNILAQIIVGVSSAIIIYILVLVIFKNEFILTCLKLIKTKRNRS